MSFYSRHCIFFPCSLGPSFPFAPDPAVGKGVMPLGERGCCFNCAGGPWRSTLAGQPRVPCTHVCRPGVSRTGPSAQENLRLLLRLPPPPAPLGSSEPRRTGFPQRTACPRQPSRSAHTHGDPTRLHPHPGPLSSTGRAPLFPLGVRWTEPKGNPHRTEDRCCALLCPSNGCETVQEAHLQSMLEATSSRSPVMLIAGGPALLVRE